MTYPEYTLTCARCGVTFVTIKKHQQFCGYSCSAKARVRPTNDELFWRKVDKNGGIFRDLGPCWLWIAGLVPDGYGAFAVNRVQVGAHRHSWELANGPIPEGLFVLHHCDNRRCVNPDHLFLGTHKDNMDDMLAKGRGLTGDRHWTHQHREKVARGDANGSRRHPERLKRGEASPVSKLTEQGVRDIRRMHQEKITYRAIAAEIGVSVSTVNQVLQGRIWKHVE